MAAHQFLLNYGSDVVDNQKVRKLLDRIRFGHIDSGKTTVISHLHMSNIFTLTNNYLNHFIHNNNKVHVRNIAVTGLGCRGSRGGYSGVRFRVGGNRKSC